MAAIKLALLGEQIIVKIAVAGARDMETPSATLSENLLLMITMYSSSKYCLQYSENWGVGDMDEE